MLVDGVSGKVVIKHCYSILLLYICLKTKMSTELLYCRLCAQRKPADQILDLAIDLIARGEIIEKLSITVNNVDFSDKSLPETVCHSCNNILNASHDFFANVKKSQVVLSKITSKCKVEYNEYQDINRLQQDTNVQKFKVIIKEEISDKQLTIKPGFSSDEELNLGVEQTDTSDNEGSLKTKQMVYVHQKIEIEVPPKQTSTSDSDESDLYSENSLSMAPMYGGVPIFMNDEVKYEDIIQSEVLINSWRSYQWSCRHCKDWFDTMEEVRTHSKEAHNMCYGFSCADCKEQFNVFNPFIEHVRQHRENLRLFCQYCNIRFEDQTQCFDHTTSHWEGTQKICDLCGEIFPDQIALERHKSIYRKAPLHRQFRRKKPKIVNSINIYAGVSVSEKNFVNTWEDYEWTCQECCMRLPDVTLLRSHTQQVHNKCFSMKCTDCLTVMTGYMMFVDHVTKHRPYLKKYCQYCNIYIEDTDLMTQHIKNHMANSPKPCDGCGHIFQDKTQLLKHMKEYDAPRLKGTLTKEDLTCDHCNKYCQSLYRLRQHRKTHDFNRERHYICDTCGKAFLSQTALTGHVKLHNSVTETCKICKRVFNSKHKLKAHVKTHSDLRPFKCDECGKDFKTKERLKSHLVCHSDIKPYVCQECGKTFKYSSNLKVHQHQHTGIRPYACEVCEKTFNSWANCNKHMIRKHDISLARTKTTPHGRVAINRLSGKPKKLESGKKVKEWMDRLLLEGDKRKIKRSKK